MAYLGSGNSIKKANRLYNKHLSDEINTHIINISDNYSLMMTWIITNYGGPSRIVGDIINNLSRKSKPASRKEKFERLERLS